MQWMNCEVAKLPRTTNFPFQVSALYFSHHLIANNKRLNPEAFFEVSIRLDSDMEYCLDSFDNIPCKLSFPNVILKRPGQHFTLISPKPRDTIAFLYSAEVMPDLEKLGFLPEQSGWNFLLTPELQRLIHELRMCIYHLNTPDTPDRLDWICFKLLRELCFLNKESLTNEKEALVQKIAYWFQLHYHETISLDEIAMQYGLSRATFYRLWKKKMLLSPVSYLQNLKLEAAAKLLLQTSLPIVQIVKNIHFSGMDIFYRKFRQKYGMTPAEYRRIGKTI